MTDDNSIQADTSTYYEHISVMPVETLDLLNVQSGKVYIDATCGAAGHSKLILDKLASTGQLFSFDQDKEVIARHEKEALKHTNWTLVHSNFENIYNYCLENSLKIDGGVLFDLGLSSIQLDDPSRGLSFNSNHKLDMRLDPDLEFSAYDVVNDYPADKLADIIYKYGEERLSRQIASEIERTRPLETCKELAELIKRVYVRRYSKTFKSNPATKTFQALRIHVNRELEVLENVLASLSKILLPGARIVIISFHSLEDRVTKHVLKELTVNPKKFNKYKNYRSTAADYPENQGYKVKEASKNARGAQESLKPEVKLVNLTKKPLTASAAELEYNARSRSAKLRAYEAIS
jgi:16S rRNA (cytosine1402-N4)-methyltransferase